MQKKMMGIKSRNQEVARKKLLMFQVGQKENDLRKMRMGELLPKDFVMKDTVQETMIKARIPITAKLGSGATELLNK